MPYQIGPETGHTKWDMRHAIDNGIIEMAYQMRPMACHTTWENKKYHSNSCFEKSIKSE